MSKQTRSQRRSKVGRTVQRQYVPIPVGATPATDVPVSDETKALFEEAALTLLPYVVLAGKLTDRYEYQELAIALQLVTQDRYTTIQQQLGAILQLLDGVINPVDGVPTE